MNVRTVAGSPTNQRSGWLTALSTAVRRYGDGSADNTMIVSPSSATGITWCARMTVSGNRLTNAASSSMPLVSAAGMSSTRPTARAISWRPAAKRPSAMSPNCSRSPLAICKQVASASAVSCPASTRIWPTCKHSAALGPTAGPVWPGVAAGRSRVSVPESLLGLKRAIS